MRSVQKMCIVGMRVRGRPKEIRDEINLTLGRWISEEDAGDIVK